MRRMRAASSTVKKSGGPGVAVGMRASADLRASEGTLTQGGGDVDYSTALLT
jgi:hypothetical protein